MPIIRLISHTTTSSQQAQPSRPVTAGRRERGPGEARSTYPEALTWPSKKPGSFREKPPRDSAPQRAWQPSGFLGTDRREPMLEETLNAVPTGGYAVPTMCRSLAAGARISALHIGPVLVGVSGGCALDRQLGSGSVSFYQPF
jgi:hypothetical protein